MSIQQIARAAGIAGVASLALAGAAAAVPYEITIERLSLDEFGAQDEQLTFSGGGTVSIDPDASGIDAIDDLSLSVQTLADIDGEDAVLTFTADETDLVFAEGLDGPPAPDLSGVVIGLGASGIESEGGEAAFLNVGSPDALTLNFGLGRAFAFCVGDQENLVQCIRGGGGSSGLEAGLEAAVIPLPATLPLALTALGGLAFGLRRRRA